MWYFCSSTYLFNVVCYSSSAQVRPWADSQDKPYWGECRIYSTWNSKDDFYEPSAILIV
jgi:hypothetical protein